MKPDKLIKRSFEKEFNKTRIPTVPELKNRHSKSKWSLWQEVFASSIVTLLIITGLIISLNYKQAENYKNVEAFIYQHYESYSLLKEMIWK